MKIVRRIDGKSVISTVRVTDLITDLINVRTLNCDRFLDILLKQGFEDLNEWFDKHHGRDELALSIDSFIEMIEGNDGLALLYEIGYDIPGITFIG